MNISIRRLFWLIHSPLVRRTAIAHSSSWSQMETRLLFRRIGQKHFAFQIRIDTDFIAQNAVFMSKMCSNSLLSKLFVAFLNRNDHIVVQSSLLSSGLPDKNHLSAEKPTRLWVKLKTHVIIHLWLNSDAKFSDFTTIHISPVYILRLSALKCWRLENERAAPPIKSHRAAGLFHSHAWVVTVASPCAHARLIQLNPCFARTLLYLF